MNNKKKACTYIANAPEHAFKPNSCMHFVCIWNVQANVIIMKGNIVLITVQLHAVTGVTYTKLSNQIFSRK